LEDSCPAGSGVRKARTAALFGKGEIRASALRMPFLSHYEFNVRSSGNVAGDGSRRSSAVGQFDISSLADGPPGFKDNGPARPKSRSGDLDVPPDHGRAFPLVLSHIRSAVAVVRGFEGHGKLGILGPGPFFQEGDVAHDFPGGAPEVSVDGHPLEGWIGHSCYNGNNGQGDEQLQGRESPRGYPSIPHPSFWLLGLRPGLAQFLSSNDLNHQISKAIIIPTAISFHIFLNSIPFDFITR